MSRRFTGWPAIVQSFGSLSGTSLGTSIRPAAAATLPKVVERPDAGWWITPFSTRHSPGETFHSAAAAATSMVRAAAPPWRTAT